MRSDNKITYIPDKEKCLTEDQTRHVYKTVETNKIINIETMKQESVEDKVTRNRLKEEEDDTELNPYQMVILNKVSRDDIKTEQMIHWSILSDSIKYTDGSLWSDMIPSLTVKPLDY